MSSESYIAITVYFLTEKCELKTTLLSCNSLEVNHTSENLSQEIKITLCEWNLPVSKIGLVVSDNASSIILTM